MIYIKAQPLQHRNSEWIALYFPASPVINALLKEQLAAKWSNTHRCWYIPLTKSAFEQLKQALPPDAVLHTDELKTWLQQKKKVRTAPSGAGIHPAVPVTTSVKKTDRFRISAVNKHILPQMEQELKLKAFSPSTIKTYLNEMAQLLIAVKDIPANGLTPEHLKRYLVYCYEKLGLKENTLHSRINALKFYYEQVLKRDKFFWAIPRPKKQLLLPKLLNEKEIGKLFNALENKKHKAMLFTAYSAGLRVSEIVNLKLKNIDSVRMQLFIENAKGKKDRYVNLSPVLVDILRRYYSTYRPRPELYLFESEQTGTAYPVRTVQQIFSNAKRKAGISKDVGIHSLRHSFATHLLEKGVDIRYIKELLGHFDIKTTERYLHVARQKLVNIVSPLDDLFEKEKIDW